MITFERDDYVILQQTVEGTSVKKRCLGLVLNKKQVHREDLSKTVDFDPEMVIANLGKTPIAGTYCGVAVEPVLYEQELKFWGTLRLYRPLSSDERHALKATLSYVADHIQHRKLNNILPVNIDIRQQRGKSLGYFRISKANRFICLMPESFLNEKELQYILLNKVAHAVNSLLLVEAPTIKLLWQKLFLRRSTIKTYSKKDTMVLLQTCAKADTLADYRKYLAANSPEDSRLFADCLFLLKKLYKLLPEDVAVLLHTNYEMLASLWPTAGEIAVDSKAAQVSEDGRKGVAEFFADGFSYYLLKRPLPDDISNGVVKTLQYLKS